MASDKLLKGLPRSLIDSYMGTLCYYKTGYMADWIYNGMIEFKIDEVIIDTFSEDIMPMEISIMPLKLYLPTLRRIIKKTLLSNEFEDDYIKSAKLIIKLDISINRTLICKSEVIDINNKIYECKEVIIKSYEDFFSVKDNLL